MRHEAAEAVGRVRLRAATATLTDWLDDPDVPTRIIAVRALGRIADAGVTTQLVRALGDADAEVRRAAVTALGAIGTRDVVVPLLGRLDDLDSNVRVDTCAVLARLHDSRAVVPLVGRAHDNAPEVRTAVFRALGELSDRRALAPLFQGLRDDADEARLAAIAALGVLRDESAVDALIEVAAARDEHTARAAISSLGLVGGARATRAVVRQLTVSANLSTTVAVVTSMVERASNDAARTAIVHEIVAAFEDADASGVRNLAAALEELAPITSIEAAVPVLLRKLAERRGDVSQIERTLATSRDARVLLPLLERLREASPTSLRATVQALAVYFRHQPPDGRAADPLLEALGRVAREARADVVTLLGRVGARRAIPAIRPFLDATDRPTRLAAVTALGAIGDAAGANLLLPLLGDRDAEIRTRAADAVGASASLEILRELVRRFVGDAPVDRSAFAHAIGIAVRHLGEEHALPASDRDAARDALAHAVRAPDSRLAAVAIDALARANDESFVPMLVTLLERGPRLVRPGAVRALSRSDSDAARTALRAALTDPDTEVASAAAAALANYGQAVDADRLVALVSALNWPVSTNASFALAHLAARGVLSAETKAGLCALLRARDPYTRANILVALGNAHVDACPDAGGGASTWLASTHHPIVRIGAARWLNELVAAHPESSEQMRAELARCVASDSSFDVTAACRLSRVAQADDTVDVTAYRPDGRTLLANTLVAVRLADGTSLIVRTDNNAHVRVWNAPRGPVNLDDPLNAALEAR
ncbi:MAG: HEAT repeat domain-containing protein [Sandaracinaceae bacterium]|nr:HEAT repeat domain-containing protein [Sandaracinaceae bacterium]